MKKILTSILCMLCLFSASMSAFEYKGINYSVVSNEDQTATVAAPNTVSGDITIPKLVMDAATATAYRVVSISDNAFKDCTELTSVTFKAELTSIGKSAFENTGLTSIVIPEAITVINESTFAGCSSLTSVTLSSATTSIGESAFSCCASLSSVTLSSATTSIGKSAFVYSGLTSIVIPEGVTTIDESTFSCCASLTNITLSSATTSIGKSAFANSGLTSIVIPEGVTTINESTFSGCANLTSVSLPSKLESIGNNAFKNSGITSLELTSSTQSIGSSAFEGCTGLKTVNYTYNYITTIGNDAFKGCTALADLNLKYDPNATTLLGMFTVNSSGKQVEFTKGNLYWDGSTYHMEANQTDYPTSWDANHVGHFYWTSIQDYQSGKASYMPYAQKYSYSSQSTSDKFWCGEENPLTVDGFSGLFALSYNEWDYLIDRRPNAANLRKYRVIVGSNKNCLIIAPDDFDGSLKSSYTLEEVNALGLVCLPAAGYRNGSFVNCAGDNGYYWSATPDWRVSDYASYLYFDSNNVLAGSLVTESNLSSRYYGRSVRLVRLAQN